MVLQETEAGISDVKCYSVPVEQTLSAAVSPATEVSQGSNTRIQGMYLCTQKNHTSDFSHTYTGVRTGRLCDGNMLTHNCQNIFEGEMMRRTSNLRGEI